MNQPPSLRDLYTPPSKPWSFSPPSGSNSTTSGSPPGVSSSYQWSTRTNNNPLLSLAASASEEDGVDVTLVIQGFLYSALLRYVNSMATVPWDVGRTLLQVQWVPRDVGERLPDSISPAEESDEEGLSDASGENERSYFADPSDPDTPPEGSNPHLLSDEKGYVVRQSVLDAGTLPEYVIPVGSADGVWGMIKRLGKFRPEGWLALWKGLLTSATTDAISYALQPTIFSLLEGLFSPLDPPPLLLPVTSQVLTGLIVSPLDLIRTRLIVQSSLPRYRAYTGPLDALRSILADEGGLRGVYFHPHIFIPALIDCTLRSAVPIIMPSLVASYLSFGGVPITAETHPFMWSVSELIGRCTGYLITVPFETVRRRLQVQVRGTAKPLKACVEIRPAPYNGIVDALWHIVTEERSDLPIKSRRRRRRKSQSAKGKENAGKPAEPERAEGVEEGSLMAGTGIGQLYRGLGMRVTASVVVFVLATFGGVDEPDAGWTEL